MDCPLYDEFNRWVKKSIYGIGERKKPTAKQRKKAAAKRRMQKKSRR
jgi:hypothetical protein